MHDPSSLLFHVRVIGLDVWHDEPGGADAFTICGLPPERWDRRLRWWWRHRHHVHYRWWPYLKVHRWIYDRCESCGRRFLWRDSRHSYIGSELVWHEVCMSLEHVRGQLRDTDAYLLGNADSNARWRVEYRLKLGATTTGDGIEVRP